MKVATVLAILDLAMMVVLGAILILGWLFALALRDAAWAVAAATIALAMATMFQLRHSAALSNQTKALTEATRDLNRIEEKRDLQARLGRAIAAADAFLLLSPDAVKVKFTQGMVDAQFRGGLYALANYTDLFSDDARKSLMTWRDYVEGLHPFEAGKYLFSSPSGADGAKQPGEVRDLQTLVEREARAWRERLVKL